MTEDSQQQSRGEEGYSLPKKTPMKPNKTKPKSYADCSFFITSLDLFLFYLLFKFQPA
jgi:hypothetical protein